MPETSRIDLHVECFPLIAADHLLSISARRDLEVRHCGSPFFARLFNINFSIIMILVKKL